MRHWTAMPSTEEIRAAALGTTMRPVRAVPSVVAVHQVIANVADLFHGPDAAAVYVVPDRHNPHRRPKPARLILVAGERVGKTREVRWYEGVVGEVGPVDPLDLSGYRAGEGGA